MEKKQISSEIDESSLLYELKKSSWPPHNNLSEVYRSSLNVPIDSPPLNTVVKPTDWVVMVVSHKDKGGVLYSSLNNKGVDRATHRSRFHSMGGQPQALVAVSNSYNDLMFVHVHLNTLAQTIKLGITKAGGESLEFPSIAGSDGIVTGHQGMRMPMFNREIWELTLKALSLDSHHGRPTN